MFMVTEKTGDRRNDRARTNFSENKRIRKEQCTPTEDFQNRSSSRLFYKTPESSGESSLRVLSTILFCLGLGDGESNDSNIVFKFLYPLIAHLEMLDIIIMFNIHLSYTTEFAGLNVIYELFSLFTLLLWHSLYRRRRSLHKVLTALRNVLQKYSMAFTKKYFIAFVLAVDFLFIIVYSCFIASLNVDVLCCALSYHIQDTCGDSSLVVVYMFLKVILINILSPFFSIFVAILYSCLSHRCAVLLRVYRKQIEAVMATEKYYMLTPELGRGYSEIVGLIEDVQSVFSFPCMLVFLVNVMIAFVVFARFLLNFTEELEMMFLLEHLFLRLPSSVLAFAMPAYAAQVSLEMQRNNAVFYKLYETMIFHPDINKTAEGLQVARTLKETLPVSLSAWEMIEFSGGTVLVMTGTFLTYSLLILNTRS